MDKVIDYIKNHARLSALVGAAFIVAAYFLFFRSSSAQTQYALTQVTKGTLVTSVSGTGQISASNQIDLVPKSSGTYIYANRALAGQFVRTGTLIAEIDPIQAQQALNSAQLDLQSAQLVLAKLQANQQNSMASSNDTLTNAQNDLAKSYQDGFNGVATSFTKLPSILNDARLTLYGTQLSATGCSPDYCAYDNLVDVSDRPALDIQIANARSDFAIASISYSQSLNLYNNTKYNDDPSVLDPLISQTLKATQDLAQAIKNESTMLNTIVSDIQKQIGRTVPSVITGYQATLASDLGTVTAQASSLQAINDSIISDKQTVAASQRTISASGQTNPIDIQTQQNVVAQRQAAVAQALSTLDQYFVRAPFDGVVAAVNAVKGAQSSGLGAAGGSAVAATMITNQKVAEVSLNEVDAAKVTVGQKATLTFDALPDLTMTGKVASIDTIGTTTQGVVSYNAKIAFDSQDARIKPGMSVSSSIITAVRQDVLMVPNGAVKTLNGSNYVQTVAIPMSVNRTQAATINASQITVVNQTLVTVGLSNDTVTEISSGLKEGDEVITRTIIGGTTKTTTTSSGLFGGGSSNAGGGANHRALQP